MKKLFTPKQVGVASLFGGPLSTVYLLSKNFLTSGKNLEAKRTKQIGIPITIIYFVALLLLPESEKIGLAAVILASLTSAYLAASFKPKEVHEKETWKSTIFNALWYGLVSIFLLLPVALIYLLVSHYVFLIPWDNI